eukprot:SAG31_NODE_24065_length_490_cov_0.670077_1_plen_73_part_00
MSCAELGAQHAEQIKGGDRMVDSMDQERERGITIISKVAHTLRNLISGRLVGGLAILNPARVVGHLAGVSKR